MRPLKILLIWITLLFVFVIITSSCKTATYTWQDVKYNTSQDYRLIGFDSRLSARLQRNRLMRKVPGYWSPIKTINGMTYIALYQDTFDHARIPYRFKDRIFHPNEVLP